MTLEKWVWTVDTQYEYISLGKKILYSQGNYVCDRPCPGVQMANCCLDIPKKITYSFIKNFIFYLLEPFAKRAFILFSLHRAQDVRKQMLGIMDRHKLDVVSCGKHVSKVQKAICSGFFRNAARKVTQ